MALREFKDSQGTEWLAWDVPPSRTYDPPRSGAERRRTVTPNYHPERRVIRERRRLRTGLGLEHGWVCFRSDAETRRLAPPPRDWAEAADDALEALCRSAAPRPARG